MASSSDRPIQANVTLNDPTVPLFDALDLTTANTEYTYVFPSFLRKYKIRNRGRAIFKYSNVSGFTTAYETVWPGEVVEEYVGSTDLTLYFQSPTAGQTLEITSWT